MSRSLICKLSAALFVLCFTTLITASPAGAKPVKVYILVGQSNMEGHAATRTIGYIGEDPATKPLYEAMVDADGNPVVSDRVWVSNLTGARDNNGVTTGKLTAGFGARRTPSELGDKFGPELTFGLAMEKAYDGPILIIKTAWGGKSLHTDFRPPSAGPYRMSEQELQNKIKRAESRNEDFDPEAAAKQLAEESGHYYRLMMDHVKSVLGDLESAHPDFDKSEGYELGGMVWFQGWNDMVASNVYPNRDEPGGYDLYSRLLATFIKDVRKDLDAPELPFVIGVMGVGGEIDPGQPRKGQQYFREAMAAPAVMDHVAAVQTWPYWDEKLSAIADKRGKVRQMAYLLRTENRNHANRDGNMSADEQKEYLKQYEAELISEEELAMWERGASNAGYHYLGCGKTLAQIGVAFAEAMIEMQE